MRIGDLDRGAHSRPGCSGVSVLRALVTLASARRVDSTNTTSLNQDFGEKQSPENQEVISRAYPQK